MRNPIKGVLPEMGGVRQTNLAFFVLYGYDAGKRRAAETLVFPCVSMAQKLCCASGFDSNMLSSR